MSVKKKIVHLDPPFASEDPPPRASTAERGWLMQEGRVFCTRWSPGGEGAVGEGGQLARYVDGVRGADCLGLWGWGGGISLGEERRGEVCFYFFCFSSFFFYLLLGRRGEGEGRDSCRVQRLVVFGWRLVSWAS